MQFEEWQPAYEAILSAFDYRRAADERARDVLASLLADEPVLSAADLDLGGTVAICGAARTLSDELAVPRAADRVVAASSAADVLRSAGVAVDCVVTDLDGTPETALQLAEAGTPVAIVAHGDNVETLRAWVPRFDSVAVLPTTQAEPRAPVENFGGFTDGDRAAFLADDRGADRLEFAGWAFDDPAVGPTKARKLQWAARLLRWLELRRDERFDVLDGRRDRLDLPWL